MKTPSFAINIDNKKTQLTGTWRACQNDFTQIPRGLMSMKIDQISIFKKQEIEKNLVV